MNGTQHEALALLAQEYEHIGLEMEAQRIRAGKNLDPQHKAAMMAILLAWQDGNGPRTNEPVHEDY